MTEEARAAEKRFLAGAFLLALAVRLAALLVWERLGLTERLGHDPYPYYAKVLLGWLPPAPVVTHPPAYSFWVAGVFALARAPSSLAVQAVNVLLGAAGAGVFALWARRRLPAPAARAAALWLALDPLLVYFSPQLQSEPLFVFLLGLFFLAVDAAGPEPRRADAFGLGLLGGVLTLTRSVVAVYPAFLAAAALWQRRSLQGAAVWLLLFAGWGVAPALWGLRNVRVHGQFIPLATNGGWTMWEGFTVDRDEVRRRPYEMREEVARLGLSDEGDRYRVGRHFSAKLRAFVREHPGESLRIVLGKALLYWRPWVYDPFPVPLRWAAGVYFTVLFLLAGVGAWSVRGDPGWAPVWALIVNLSALHAVMFTSLRYRTPLEPFLVCLAAQGLLKLVPGARKSGSSGLAAALLVAALAAPGQAASGGLSRLTLEQLMDVPVVTASKKPEPWFTAPAAVTVITGDELRRSGATTLAEALRLAPGVQVSRLNASQWAVGIRGFANAYANKLLVLVDGRSVYAPIFSGTFWDVSDTVLEDVERIEVVRGPGGALWGENAVNGVVNVITKAAADTPGWLASGGAGTAESGFGAARYGGRRGERLRYRVYAKHFDRSGQPMADGSDGPDRWRQARGGLRADWDPGPDDALSVGGELYRGVAGETVSVPVTAAPFSRLETGEGDVSGGHLLGRWRRELAGGSELALQASAQRDARSKPASFSLTADVFDLDVQHRFRWARQETVWGAGYRLYDDDTRGGNVRFIPAARTTRLWSVFVNDEATLVEDRLKVSLGSKFEHNDYTGIEVQPGARLVWTPVAGHAAWAAVSRALRAPARSDHDLSLTAAAVAPGIRVQALGDPAFKSEELVAYEAGYRAALHPRLTLDAAAFYNVYHRVRLFVTQPASGGQIPALITNRRDGQTHGAELAARWQAAAGWRLEGTFTVLRMYLAPDAATQADQNGDSPRHQAALRSSWDLARSWELDLGLRYADALPNKGLPRSLLGDVRLGWRPRPGLEAALVGRDLLERRHAEFSSTGVLTQATQVRPSVYAVVTWRH